MVLSRRLKMHVILHVSLACISKYNVDNALEVVNDYGNRWPLPSNAKKSAIIVYGENRRGKY